MWSCDEEEAPMTLWLHKSDDRKSKEEEDGKKEEQKKRK